MVIRLSLVLVIGLVALVEPCLPNAGEGLLCIAAKAAETPRKGDCCEDRPGPVRRNVPTYRLWPSATTPDECGCCLAYHPANRWYHARCPRGDFPGTRPGHMVDTQQITLPWKAADIASASRCPVQSPPLAHAAHRRSIVLLL